MNPICNLGRQHPLSLAPLQTPFPSAVRFRLSPRRSAAIRACASGSEIDMVRDRQGIYQPKPKKIVILWDLDNKPPRGPPYSAAVALKTLASKFGEVSEASAYANRHAFVHLPQWVLDQRRDRRSLDVMERKGIVAAAEPYLCGVCGRKCKTNLDLKKHFKQLHERERKKKVNRMNSLKGKKKQRFKERYITGNEKYTAAAREILTPKVGYGLAGELRRAGVVVRTVEDKPQAADWALKRQMQHSMSSGVDWLLLVSDDSDFSEMLRRARAASLGTVVVGDWDKALGRQADVWVPWVSVENGNITDRDLVPRRRPSAAESFGDEESDDDEFESDDDRVVLSAFSEAEGFDERFHLFDSDDDEEEDGIF